MRKTTTLTVAVLVAVCATLGGLEIRAQAQQTTTQPRSGDTPELLPPPPESLGGAITIDIKDSRPDFPQPIHAPAGAPNVLLVLLDDVGFGASSPFGGPVNTPTLDNLAKNGLRYNQFHTTALCSPTRAALLTGRNHHSVHAGTIMEAGTGYPGYDTIMQKDTATVAEVLKQNGYATAWFGKNHNVPDWQTSQANPFDLWPTGLGFEKFYGFIGGDTNVFDETKPIEPYVGNPDYNLDYAMADEAITWIQAQKALAPDKPFFAYYAPGATHAPHHPKKEWVQKYTGKFDQGWDKVREETLARQKGLGIVPTDTKLTPRSPGIPAWAGLTADQKKVYARMMEIYAGYLEQTDYNVGRVVEAIRETSQLDNTLIIYIVGDNGASAEGGFQDHLNEMTVLNGVSEDVKVLARVDDLGISKAYNDYAAGWAHAMNTPMQWANEVASHYGGTRNGLVISWPKGIAAKGEIRQQWHHVIDIVPTIYEATGIAAPVSVNGVTQKPIEGVSMMYSFADGNAKSRRPTQYFEMFANRAIYNNGWIACTTPTAPRREALPKPVDLINSYKWELYDTTKDFSEADDLAATMPDKLKELQLLFYAEAARHKVLPLDNSKVARLDPSIRPSLTSERTTFTYHQGMTRIPESAIPDIKNKSWSIVAEVEVKGGTTGTIVTQGGLTGGWALYLDKGKPVFHYNYLDIAHYNVAAKNPLTPGKHTITMQFTYDGGGTGKGGTATLAVDGREVANGRFEKTVPIRFSLDEGLDVGEDTGTPVNLDYDVPFKFTGKINEVVIEIGETGLKAGDVKTLEGSKKRVAVVRE